MDLGFLPKHQQRNKKEVEEKNGKEEEEEVGRRRKRKRGKKRGRKRLHPKSSITLQAPKPPLLLITMRKSISF